MKPNDLLLLGALGLGAYLLLKKDDSSTVSGGDSFGGAAGGYAPGPSQLVPPPPLRQLTTASPSGKLRQSSFSTVPQGVQQLNDAVASGQRIVSPGYTLVPRGGSFTDNSTGRTYTLRDNQNVSKLADGQVKVLTVQQPKTRLPGT